MPTNATGTPTSPDSLAKLASGDAIDVTNAGGINAIVDTVQTALNTRISKPASPGVNDALIWNGTTWVNGGLPYSKLTLTNTIVNADIASGAAIVATKYQRAVCSIYRGPGAGAQSFGTGAGTVTFDSVRFDPLSMWAGGTPTRVTLPYTGKYRITAVVGLTFTGTGSGNFRIRKNGTTTVMDSQSISTLSVANGLQLDDIASLSTGDYLEMFWSGSGAGTTTTTANTVPGITAASIGTTNYGSIYVEFLG